MAWNIKAHQKWIMQVLDNPDDYNLKLVIDEHLRQLGFLQHERLIHLIVTMCVLIFAALIGIIATVYPMFVIIALILIGLELCYLAHYYFLENTTQRWYGLYNQLRELRDKNHK
ncbi:MAG: hypothetical protein Q3996_01275 [Candidatus Saccharibacteria bacterium]|nr:hypothetical protein [Candidatus Saccharibacteria bacterium]